MIIIYLVKGIIIGFLIAAPVGPVGLLCIRRALADGRLAAFVAGLGAAVADTFYGAVAGLGLSLISDFLFAHREALSLIGGSVLLVLGIQAMRGHASLPPPPKDHFGLLKDFTTTLLITLTNPATILAFMGVFVSFGAVSVSEDAWHAASTIFGVFLGSALWWLTLSALAGAVRHHFSDRWLGWLNKGSGGLLLASAFAVLGSLVF